MNPHARITKYRVFLYNVETGERQMVCAAGRDLMTKWEANRLIKKGRADYGPLGLRERSGLILTKKGERL